MVTPVTRVLVPLIATPVTQPHLTAPVSQSVRGELSREETREESRRERRPGGSGHSHVVRLLHHDQFTALGY